MPSNDYGIHDVAMQGEVHYLVMEYVDGQTLDQLLEKGGPITPSRAVAYIAQAAAGLQHAHEKSFVHRDIKPANLILAKDGTVKILDMGLARSFTAETDKLTEVMDQGAILGTADFISPEQAMNTPGIDIRADIYSLGCTLYYLLTGQVPFPDGTTMDKLIAHADRSPRPVTAHRHDLPPEVVRVVERMMAKGKAHGIETRGVSDHGFIHSIYLRDPNGYVIELTAKTAAEHEELDPSRARKVLDDWQAAKARA